MGLIAANILVEPQPRQSQRKALNTARVYISKPGPSAKGDHTAVHKSTGNAQPAVRIILR